MELRILIGIILLAFFVAKLEINIEGKFGWAEKLSTWRINNKLIEFFLNGSPLTGYHFWLFTMILFLLHFPFIVGLDWNFSTELTILGMFFLFLVVEDFLWFVLNPYFGLRKFNRSNIPWHKKWIGFVPRSYLYGASLSLIFLIFGIMVKA